MAYHKHLFRCHLGQKRPSIGVRAFIMLLALFSTQQPVIAESTMSPPEFYRGIQASGLNGPHDVTTDSAGNVYVIDGASSSRVRKYDSEGKLLTSWGGLGVEATKFSNPGGISSDQNDAIYVVDTGNYRIQKFDQNGTFILEWGHYGSGNGQFLDPKGIAADRQNNIYVSDTGGITVDDHSNISSVTNARIQKFDSQGNYITGWEIENPSGFSKFFEQMHDYTHGIAIDANDHVYVADTYNYRMHKFDNGGNLIFTWGAKELFKTPDGDLDAGHYVYGGPFDIGISDHYIFVIDSYSHRAQVFDRNHKWVGVWGFLGTAEDQHFNTPVGIDIDQHGNAYVADMENNRIQKFDSGLIFQWSAGVVPESLQEPVDIEFDDSGHFYVLDKAPGNIKKFKANGGLVSQWGRKGSADNYDNDEFNRPFEIAVTTNKVYVADNRNSRVQVFDTNGNFIDTLAPSGREAAHIHYPAGIEADDHGNVYVAEVYNSSVKAFDAQGNFLWQSGGEFDPDARPGTYGQPWGVTVDRDGYIYVTDIWFHQVHKLAPDGTFITRWGSEGDQPGQFLKPVALTTDQNGNVYVSDWELNTVQVFDSDGNYLTQFGGSGFEAGQFNFASGLAVNDQGHIYVTDRDNKRVQVFAYKNNTGSQQSYNWTQHSDGGGGGLQWFDLLLGLCLLLVLAQRQRQLSRGVVPDRKR